MTDFKIQIKDKKHILVKYTGRSPDVILPDCIDVIGRHAFYQCESLTSIQFPASVHSIETEAFYGCHSLKSVLFSEGLLEIHHRAFWFCTSLAEVTFPESLSMIGSRAFECCSRLTSITLKNEGTFVDEYAFHETPYWHQTLKKAALCSPRNYKGVPPRELRLPEGTVHIDIWAYAGSGILSAYLPNSLRTVGMSAFKDCKSLKEVSLTPNVYCNYNLPLGAGDGIFAGCTSLEQVTIRGEFTTFVWTDSTEPDFLKGFDREKTFTGCTSLKRIVARKIPLSRIPYSWQRYAVNGYLSDLDRDTHYPPFIREEYEAHTCRIKDQLVKRTRFETGIPLYEYLMSRHFITEENFDEVFQNAVQTGCADIAAALLEYRHRGLRPKTAMDELFDDFADL